QVAAMGGQRSVRRQWSVGERVASCPRLRPTTADRQRCTMRGAQAEPTPQETRARRCTMKSALDDALERLRHTGPEEPGGAPNRGPMAAEALVALGCDDEVPQWVDHYRSQLGPMPETILPLTPQTWHDALGIHRRVGDWVVFFHRQLSAAPWQAVLSAWFPR